MAKQRHAGPAQEPQGPGPRLGSGPSAHSLAMSHEPCVTIDNRLIMRFTVITHLFSHTLARFSRLPPASSSHESNFNLFKITKTSKPEVMKIQRRAPRNDEMRLTSSSSTSASDEYLQENMIWKPNLFQTKRRREGKSREGVGGDRMC